MLIFKGKRKGMIHTMNIEWKDIRAVFFPKDFYEKYKYLGSVPWRAEGDIFKAMEPLVIFMDSKAKPWWCPRWVLRFLHLFGSDNSIVRVRNQKLHNWSKKLTKGLLIWDYKTKWSEYDLRISISGTEQMNWLADAIELKFYRDGRREYLIENLKQLKPRDSYNLWATDELEKEFALLTEND